MRYRVDTIPRLVRPLYAAVTWSLGLLLYSYYALCRLTSRVSIEGPGKHDLSQHAIFCLWHESWSSYFAVFARYRSPHAMLNHPAAYMKPLHTVLQVMGLRKLLLGSSGDEGRRAANELADLIQRGYATTISPDGPHGPPRVLKKGVLHIALQSGAPIVPLTICSSRYIPWPSWDSKKFPLPFSRFKVIFHERIWVHRHNFDDAAARIVKALGSPDRSAPTRCAA
jgi:lysophospholipid acyltransferase (LPLAT)-like uncharacterized protein